jgi:hypothetical protein
MMIYYVISVMYMFCLFGWNRKNKLKRFVLVTLPSVTLGRDGTPGHR